MAKDIIKQMEALEQKANTIRNKYDKALEDAETEKAELLQDIAKTEEEVKDYYKSYVLNEITLEAYRDITKDADKKRESLRFLEQKVNDIEGMKKEELASVIAEYNQIQKDFYKLDKQNKAEQRKKLLQAKIDFLTKIKESKAEINKTHKFNRVMDEIKVESGLKNDYSYDMTGEVVNDLLPNHYNNKAGVTVTKEEVSNAYYKNETVPYTLRKEGFK